MTQLISKDYLMDHVIDVPVNGTYEEAVLLEDIYKAQTIETAKIRGDCDGCKYEHRGESDEPCNICRNNYMCQYEEAYSDSDVLEAVKTIKDYLKTQGKFTATSTWEAKDGKELYTDWGYFNEGINQLIRYFGGKVYD